MSLTLTLQINRVDIFNFFPSVEHVGHQRYEAMIQSSIANQQAQDEEEFKDLPLAELQRLSALEDLYHKRAKTRKARAEAAKIEAEAAKAEAEAAKARTVARLYEMKTVTFEKNFTQPPPNSK